MKIKKLQNLQLINHWSIIISSKTFSQSKNYIICQQEY
jgi:hypothetical protein